MHVAKQNRPQSVLRQLLSSEASGGLLLMGAAVLALVVANSPAAFWYFSFFKTRVFGMSILHWVNDALMALFFLLIGLEIKREIIDGELSTWQRRALPCCAALGGMVAPALIYVAFNAGTPETLRGWAIPMATDIAFALGVLTLLGERVRMSLRVFLTALAILDDLGSVLVIALFYTSHIDVEALALAAATLSIIAVLNLQGVNRIWPYMALGAVLWFLFLKSGVHATLAGVVLASTIPLRRTRGGAEASDSALIRLERALQPWVAFLVLPVFGFANAGVALAGMSATAVFEAVPLGIAMGLFLGKQVGVFLFAWAAIKTGLADLPRNANWSQFYGVAILCGIGFTMSLFIGLLAFPESPERQDAVKIGVLSGSLLSAALGALLLTMRRPDHC